MNFKTFYKYYFKNFSKLILDERNMLYLDKIALEIEKIKKNLEKYLCLVMGVVLL